MKARPTQSRKGVKGQLPLAGSRDSVPCGVWGNAPTVPRATSMPNALNKGAGSEASLPVTLRVRRRAPKLLYPQLAYCRAKWARPSSCSFLLQMAFPEAQGLSPLRRRVGGNENRRSLRSPPTPLCGAHAHAWLLSWQGKTTLAGVNPAIIALLWGSPHANGCKNHPNCDQKMKNPRKRVIMLARE